MEDGGPLLVIAGAGSGKTRALTYRVARLIERGFAAGFPLGRYYKGMENSLLICVTEKRTKQEIGMLAEALESVL